MSQPAGGLVERIAAAARAAAAFFLGVMSLIVIYTVAQRYLLGRTPYWSEELPRLLLIWAAFLGAVATAAHGGHLSAGLLPLIVRDEAARRGIARLRGVLGIVFCLVMVKAGADLTLLTASQLTAALQISAGWAYAASTVGFAGLALILLLQLVVDRPEA